MNGSWDPWKVTAIAMALMMATALVTGLVVANRAGDDTRAAVSTGTASAPAPRVAQPSTIPPQAAVDACNRYAASQTGDRDKTAEVVKDAAVGAVVGAAVGAAGGAIAGGGKGAAIGSVVGAGGGTLYGLNESKKHDERYREAYAGCMRSRGYAG